MKSLKFKGLILAIALVSMSITVNGQPQQRKHHAKGGERGKKVQQSPEKFAEKQTDLLDQRLELTDAQEKTIYKIYLSQATARKSEMDKKRSEREAQIANKEKGVRPTRDEMREMMTAQRDAKKDNLKEVISALKDEQKIDFALMLSQNNCKKDGHKMCMRVRKDKRQMATKHHKGRPQTKRVEKRG